MDCIKATVSAFLYPWRRFWSLYQMHLDKTVLHVRRRWLVTAALASIFALRVFYLRGFYTLTICLSWYTFFLLFDYATPFVEDYDINTPSLPVKGSDEFKPFIGLRTEFQVWYALTTAYIISITMTFYSIFDVTYAPPLLWFLVCLIIALTMMKISHIIKHRYLPFTIGKQGIRW